ncbi:MAG: uridine kinase [Clostridiales bacterium]|nr:uridine kinase [Clostridiales bacterium]
MSYEKFLGFDAVVSCIKINSRSKNPLIVAIDGKCCSGKTAFARQLGNVLDCNVIHTDDFFLRAEQRTPERYKEPGGNIDYERFLSEVLIPLTEQRSFSYRPYSCKLQDFSDPVQVEPRDITIIEGAYSCHPKFSKYIDLKIFMSIDEQEQQKRILSRNGREELELFLEKWIPLEEEYFKAFNIAKKSDLQLYF